MGQKPSVVTHGVEEFHKKMDNLFRTTYDTQVETNGIWIGTYDRFHGDLFWAYGSSNLFPNATATTDDHFDIGSISKSFGATVNLQLAEQGYFDIHNDTVKFLLPTFTARFPQYAEYTPADLMGMRTLVPDFLNDPNGMIADLIRDPTKRYSIEDIVEFALADGMTDDNRCWPDCGQYSTTNILVMELLAEHVTGKSMPDLVKELVLAPLGLNETAQPPRNGTGSLPIPAATPYAGPSCHGEFMSSGGDSEGNLPELGEDLTNFSHSIVSFGTGGSIYSTIPDLLQWAKSGNGDSLLSPSSLEARHSYRPIVEGLEYGLGSYKEPFVTGGAWRGHDGDALGYGAVSYYSADHNAAFVAATNSCSTLILMLNLFQAYINELQETELDRMEKYKEAAGEDVPVNTKDVSGIDTSHLSGKDGSHAVTMSPALFATALAGLAALAFALSF